MDIISHAINNPDRPQSLEDIEREEDCLGHLSHKKGAVDMNG
jgi:hypothetical protein